MGLIYGPSGCGKSSLVKAGLLPRLAKHVVTVYIEATPEETETRLLESIAESVPRPATGTGPGRFPGWRSGKDGCLRPVRRCCWSWTSSSNGSMRSVARRTRNWSPPCDSATASMSRRSSWCGMISGWRSAGSWRSWRSNCFKGQNTALVDLFDPPSCRKVLTAFGQAYGSLPERDGRHQPGTRTPFWIRAITELAQDGKVISVRLALFAEMVKGKPWTPATLREVGGTEGVGVTFLEETFSFPAGESQASPPPESGPSRPESPAAGDRHRHQGTDAVGSGNLHEASGYADRPRDFADLIHILDGELRLITPTDPEGSGDDPRAPAPPGGRYYQLTHDYLVHSLRDWLTRKQRETRRGRAELRLAEARRCVERQTREPPPALGPGVGQHPGLDKQARLDGDRTRDDEAGGAVSRFAFARVGHSGGGPCMGRVQHVRLDSRRRAGSIAPVGEHRGSARNRRGVEGLSSLGRSRSSCQLAQSTDRSTSSFTSASPCCQLIRARSITCTVGFYRPLRRMR